MCWVVLRVCWVVESVLGIESELGIESVLGGSECVGWY